LYRIDEIAISGYVSEIVLSSVRIELRTTEVPVRFLKDQEGRSSHHKRAGWFRLGMPLGLNLHHSHCAKEHIRNSQEAVRC
jgi:hypothetical protein